MRWCGGRQSLGLQHRLNVELDRGFRPGDYVARMDADDVAMPTRFLHQLDYLDDHPDVDLVGAQAVQIDERGEVQNPLEYPVDPDACVRVLHRLNPVLHPTFMFRAGVVARHGLRYPVARNTEDLALLVTMTGQGLRFANVPTVELHWRQSDDFFRRRHSLRRGLAELRWFGRAGRVAGVPARGYLWSSIRLCFRLLPHGLIVRCYRSRLRSRVVRNAR